MMFPFLTLEDNTEIVHSEMLPNGTVKLCVEKPVIGGFHNAWCIFPEYRWEEVCGFSSEEIKGYERIIKAADLMQFA